MAKVCRITGKKATRGNHVAHCNKKVRRNFKANIHTRRIFVPSEGRFITLKLSPKALRSIDKNGIEHYLAQIA